MTKDIVFISDFFIEEIIGGAEKYNDALIKALSDNRSVIKIKSANVDISFVSKHIDKVFIVANFFLLKSDVKSFLKETTYFILEHDHKYVSNNNPAVFRNFLAHESKIINKQFYSNSKAIICQSKIHSEVLQKNLFLNNVVNMGGNLWTLQDIDILKQNINNQKKIEFAILKTNNLNKGMTSAINFCKKNKINFHYLESKPYGEFIEILSKVENLIFFPQWLESYNRLSIEARILGCKLITNNLIGAASEDYFRLKNKDLLKKIEENNITIVNRWKKMIDEDQISFIDKIKNFKISVFCPIYNAQKYIKNFLDDMVSQTFFEKSEIIIIDANSPQNEFDTISKYMEKYSNIVYKRLDYRASVMETENMAIKMAKGDFIAQCCVDDRHSIEYLEIMSKHLIFDESVDLVYSDCFQTNKDNETFALNSSGGLLYEHSKKSFSKHNMIKCLPGPMPMWRKSIHEKVGFFKEEMRYAGDWEFFLRMVDMGCKFKKIDVPLGLYYFNADGLSTSEKYQKERGKEEADVFFKYKHVFGEANYKKYVNYFSQFRS